MQFKTTIPPLKHTDLLTYKSKITLLGSCFTENIGSRLENYQFDTTINPFGIVFNPLSLLKQLRGNVHNESHFIEEKGRVLSLDCHSKFNASTKADLSTKIAVESHALKERVSDSDVLMLTFGTAWVYQYSQTKQVIANCQKLPSQHFTKKSLSLNDLVIQYCDYFNQLIQTNPKIKIVLTVSPVRHIKDGFIDNSRSKATLVSLCAELEDIFQGNVIYLPSYELVMDDLRDYRFYEKDLIHLNDFAVDYIFQYVQKSFMSDHTRKILELVQKYNRLKNHRDLASTEADKQARGVKLSEMAAEIDSLKLS